MGRVQEQRYNLKDAARRQPCIQGCARVGGKFRGALVRPAQNSLGSESGFEGVCFCARQVAGGMPNWVMNQRVKELAMEYPSMSAMRPSE